MKQFIGYLIVLCLLAGIAHAGTWVEDFDDGNIDGWQLVIGSDAHRAQVDVVDDELVFRHFEIGFSEDWLVLEASRTWSDYILKLRLKFTEEVGPNSPKGALITYNDTFDSVPEGGPNSPFLFIQPEGTVMGMVGKNGTWETPASTGFTFTPGVWYQFTVLVQGSHYECAIDGQHVLEYDDATFLSGGIGIGARDVVVHFDDIRITGDSVLDGGSVAVGTADKLATTWAGLRD